MKIKENIKKHKLIKSKLIEKTVFIVNDTKTNTTNILSGVVGILAEYLIKEDFTYGDLYLKLDDFTYSIIYNTKTFMSVIPYYSTNKGWMIGYFMGVKCYLIDGYMGYDNVTNLYNKEELIGKIKWEQIQ